MTQYGTVTVFGGSQFPKGVTLSGDVCSRVLDLSRKVKIIIFQPLITFTFFHLQLAACRMGMACTQQHLPLVSGFRFGLTGQKSTTDVHILTFWEMLSAVLYVSLNVVTWLVSCDWLLALPETWYYKWQTRMYLKTRWGRIYRKVPNVVLKRWNDRRDNIMDEDGHQRYYPHQLNLRVPHIPQLSSDSKAHLPKNRRWDWVDASLADQTTNAHTK